MEFTSSLEFGNSVLANIENAEKSYTMKKNKGNDIPKKSVKCEVIDESPTNKSTRDGKKPSENSRNALTQSRYRRRALRKNKSDSILQSKIQSNVGDKLNIPQLENVSDYFQSPMKIGNFVKSKVGKGERRESTLLGNVQRKTDSLLPIPSYNNMANYFESPLELGDFSVENISKKVNKQNEEAEVIKKRPRLSAENVGNNAKNFDDMFAESMEFNDNIRFSAQNMQYADENNTLNIEDSSFDLKNSGLSENMLMEKAICSEDLKELGLEFSSGSELLKVAANVSLDQPLRNPALDVREQSFQFVNKDIENLVIDMPSEVNFHLMPDDAVNNQSVEQREPLKLPIIEIEEAVNVEETSFLGSNGNSAKPQGQTITESLIVPSKKEILPILKAEECSFRSMNTSILQRTNLNIPVRETDEHMNLSKCSGRVLNWSVSSSSETPPKNSTPQRTIKQSAQLDSKLLKDITKWGLPDSVTKEYQCKGITKMFDWQVECLSNPKVLFEHANLVYSAPTSAGKTLVSELLTIKTVLERKKKALIILPFISVVREKMSYLQDLLTSSGYRVDGFFGGYSPPGGFENIHIAICTIEKANSIINKLLEHSKLDDIGMIVVDEIHLISDPGRGYILELLLAKITYMCRKYGFQIQIVSMSATLSNIVLLQKWLQAEFYVTSYRPVELQEMIKVGTKIYNNQMELIRELKCDDFVALGKDPDQIAQLCIETILIHCSAIVFCPSKDWCETLCLHLAESIMKMMKLEGMIGEKITSQIKRSELDEVKIQLKNCSAGLDTVLAKTVSFGCAFHHAGLTTEERDIIEMNFKTGALKILVATSTLSSGVNLPARRVIIRSPLFAGKKMNSLTYKQMIGRAGRTGKDTLGESILICTDTNVRTGKELVCSELLPIKSCLSLESSMPLKRALLEVISSGIASSKEDVKKFLECTLLHVQNMDASKLNGSSKQHSDSGNHSDNEKTTQEEKDPLSDSLNFLIEFEFIRLQMNEQTNEMNYVPTRLGMACLSSSLPPNDGLLLFSELQKSRRCFVLETELHAVYLVTPYSVCYQINDIDWLLYLDLHDRLSSAMKRVAELVGVKESFLVKATRGNSKLDYKTLQIHKRFYTAMALQELVNEVPLNKVSEKYKCSRGLLQSLQQMSSTFAGIVTSFCNALNWTMLGLIVSEFKERLFFGVHRDLIDLMRIPDLNGQKARALFNAGITNLVDLANADCFTLEKILFNSVSFDSEKKREDEDEYDANKRNLVRCLYITGRTGLTIKDVAKLLISHAQQYLQHEIGVKNVRWNNQTSEDVEVTNKDEIKADATTSINVTNPKLIDNAESLLDIKTNDLINPSNNKETKPISLNINEVEHINEHNTVQTKSTAVTEKCSNLALRKSPRNHPRQENNNFEKDYKKATIFKTSCATLRGTIQNPNKANGTETNGICFKEPIQHSNTAATAPGTILSEATDHSSKAADTKSPHSVPDGDVNPKPSRVSDIFNDSTLDINSQIAVVLDKQNTQKEHKVQNLWKLNENQMKVDSSSPTNKSVEEIVESQTSKATQRSLRSNATRMSRARLTQKKLASKAKKEQTKVDVDVKIKPNASSSIEISDCASSSLLKNPMHLNSSHILSTSKTEAAASFKCLSIVDLCGNKTLFRACMDEINKAKYLGLSVAVQKLAHKRRPVIGANLLINQVQNCKEETDINFIFDDAYYIAGLSLCIEGNTVLFFNLQNKDNENQLNQKDQINNLLAIFGNEKLILRIFDAKEQLKVLRKCMPELIEIKAKIEDPKVGHWLLEPDKDLTLKNIVQQYAPECSALISLAGSYISSHSIGLNTNSSILGKVRASVEACVSLHVLESQLENMERIANSSLKIFFHELEMPVQCALWKMETVGFPVDEGSLGNVSKYILDVMKKLEKKMYQLHGSRFNVASTSAVARVLGLHRKPNGRFSTAKQILEKIDSPMANMILNYRKLGATLNKTIQPLIQLAREGRIHGNSISYTSTGRISMHEPNLQNVAKDFNIEIEGEESHFISCRSSFACVKGKSLISVDYCQLEMRILTHLSQDEILTKIMNSEEDIFRAIAARWNKIPQDEVSESVRNGTKQICYGVIYGMGLKSLAESLKCDSDDAAMLVEQFHSAYPGIRLYTNKVIKFAKQNGYVETITGRRRYLPHITIADESLKGQAERQAVNTTIQGSAADIAKKAILRTERNLLKYCSRIGISAHDVQFVLHLHDELLFEVPENKVSKIAKVLRASMENSAELGVPLRVKIRAGESWGTLKEI